jgi:hypothetical protein
VAALIAGFFAAGMWANGGIGPIGNLQGRVDSNNALVVTAAAAGTTGASTSNIANLPGKVDSSNNLVVTVAGGTITPASVSIAQGTLTADAQALTSTATWNNAAIAFTHWKAVITDTASAAGSMALQLFGGAAGTTNLLSVSKAGVVTMPTLSLGTGADTFLVSDGANIAAMKNSTTAQEFRVYGTTTGSKYTSITNDGASAVIDGVGTSLLLRSPAGTVSLTAGSGNIQMVTGNNLIWQTDNGTDLGASGANRPRTGYFGTSVIAPTVNAATTVITALFRSTVAKVLLQGTGTGATQLAFTQTTPPTCTSANGCGTGNGTFATGSSDTGGSVTLGTTPSATFTITFNATWGSTPICKVWMNKAGMANTKEVLTSVATTTTIPVVLNAGTPSTGDIYAYYCFSLQ